MNKQDLYAYLTEKNIPHEITEHGAVYNMDDLAAANLPYPEAEAKICLCGTIKSSIII